MASVSKATTIFILALVVMISLSQFAASKQPPADRVLDKKPFRCYYETFFFTRCSPKCSSNCSVKGYRYYNCIYGTIRQKCYCCVPI